MYTMSVTSRQWTKLGVEGSLYLVRRSGVPRYRLLVLNKTSTQNFLEDIDSELEFELNPPYLMYTHGNSEIVGVWFYDADDLQRVQTAIGHMNAALRGAPMASSAASAAGPSGGDTLEDADFWDKPASQAQQKAAAQRAAAVQGREAGAALFDLLKKGTASEASPAGAKGPLPPSFFAQAAAAPAAAVVQASGPQPPSAAGGNALAKLFANAQKPAAPAAPPAPAAAPLPPAVQQPPVHAAPAAPRPDASTSDEEKVRRLLTRIATNDAIVKLLAVEMRAVGLL
jgi:mRNA-decapping enzyme 1B